MIATSYWKWSKFINLWLSKYCKFDAVVCGLVCICQCTCSCFAHYQTSSWLRNSSFWFNKSRVAKRYLASNFIGQTLVAYRYQESKNSFWCNFKQVQAFNKRKTCDRKSIFELKNKIVGWFFYSFKHSKNFVFTMTPQ